MIVRTPSRRVPLTKCWRIPWGRSLAVVKAIGIGKLRVNCRRPVILALFALSTALLASRAIGQVLEIGSDGDVKVYDGPTVFTDHDAIPIQPPRTTRRPPTARPVDRQALVRAAQAANLSPALVGAVAWRESGLRPDRISRAGAVGEMQLMPSTARALGVDPSVDDQNLKGGAAYLNQMMRRYDGDLVRALAAYNAGPAAVDRYRGVPPYKETQAYVAAVLDRLSQAVVPKAEAHSTAALATATTAR